MLPAAASPRRKEDRLWAFLLVLAALALLLGLQRLEPRFFLRDDNAALFLPAYVYTYETVVGLGEVPLLNHHQMFGGTFLASGMTGFFQLSLYPVAAGLDLLGRDFSWLIDSLASLHLVLAALGMFFLLRFLGIRPALAALLALCWAGLPFGLVISRSWVVVSYLMAFLPWNHLLLLRFLDQPERRRGLLLLAVKTLYFFYGYVNFIALFLVFEAAFLLFYFIFGRAGRVGRAGRGAWRRLAALAVLHGLIGLLTAPLWIPLWQAKEASAIRAGRLPAEEALASALTAGDFFAANLFAPRAGVLEAGSTAIYFLGPLWLVGLAGALFGFSRLPPATRAALAAGWVALAMCTSAYWILYQTPLFGSLRWPFKAFPMAAFYLLLPVAAQAELWAGQGSRRAARVCALAGLNLLLEGLVLLPADWRMPFNPVRLDRSVAALREAPLLRQISDQGRVALVGSIHDPWQSAGSLGLGYLFATLAGKYAINGYDPLRARINIDVGIDLYSDGMLQVPEQGWAAAAKTLPARYLIVPARSRLLPELLATPSLRRLAYDGLYLLFENAAALPVVSLVESRRELPFRWRTNGIEVELPADSPGGPLLFNVAGLEGYRWYWNGVAMGEPERVLLRPLVRLPPGPGRLELRYIDRGFQLGWACCGMGLLGLLLALRRGEALLTGSEHGPQAAEVEN